MSKPKLLHITTIPDSLMFLSGQIEYMQSIGFEVHTLSSQGDIPSDLARITSLRHHTVEMARRITPGKDLIALAALVKQICSIRPIIVHSHTPKGGLLGMISAWLARVPVRVYHIHGLPFVTASGGKRFLLKCSERLACRLAHQVLCVSDSARDIVISEGFCDPKKIKVLVRGSINGVDAEVKFNPDLIGNEIRMRVRKEYGIPEEAVVIGFAGRVVRDKGVNELAEAWQCISEEFPDAHLMMVGDFEEEDPIPYEAEVVLRNDARIHITGVVWDMPPMYRAMDMLVLPTYREGFPVVPLEAASMGLPIIASKVTGCVDAIVDGVTGTLVPPRNSQALAEAMRLYLNNPEMREKHGDFGRKRVHIKFRPQDIWEATYSEYRRLLVQKRVRADLIPEERRHASQTHL